MTYNHLYILSYLAKNSLITNLNKQETLAYN